MRKNLLKQLTMALLLTVAVPTLNAQVHVGDILCEGNAIVSPANYPSSGATAIGVVFYVDNTGQHGWAVALQDAGEYSWGNDRNDTPLPNYPEKRQAVYDLDGYENTRILREDNTAHPAIYAVDFANGWYVPAIGQLNILYGNIMEVNDALTVAGGVAFTLGGWKYWSSTELSGHKAWCLNSVGDLDDSGSYNSNWCFYYNKSLERLVRAVRNF